MIDLLLKTLMCHNYELKFKTREVIFSEKGVSNLLRQELEFMIYTDY